MHLAVAIILGSLAASLGAPSQALPTQSPAGFTRVRQHSDAATVASFHPGRAAYLSPSFAIVTAHYRDARLDAAIARSLDRIETKTGISIPTSPSSAGASGAADR